MTNLLNLKNIYLNLEVKNKKELFQIVAQKAQENGYITNKKAVVKSFLKREKEGTTGLEFGFAIPHAKCMEIKQAALFYLTLQKTIKWKSLDKKPITNIIALLIPNQANNQHLIILSKIATKLMDNQFQEKLKNTKTEKEILKILDLEKEDNNQFK